MSNFSNSGSLRIGRRATKRASVYLFAGALDKCGSSTVAYNFAHTLAGTGASTVLVDLDLQGAGLSKLFNTDNVRDCSIDTCMSGQSFSSYMNNIDDHVLKVSIGRRRIPFISCNSINSYSSENKRILKDFDFSKLLMALTSRYDNVVVDIGIISQIDKYQSRLLKNENFKNFVCYSARNQNDLIESAQNVYNVQSSFSMILSNADESVKRVKVEQKFRRPVAGVIPFNGRFMFHNRTSYKYNNTYY